jgi:putative ABC transport system permease protein
VTGDSLKERGGSDPAGGTQVRSLLVAAEVAIAIVLLVGGALLMESFLRLRSASPGFNPKHALTFRVTLPPARYPTRLDRNRFAREALRRLAAAPGVVAAGLIDSVPIGEDRQGTGFTIEGPSSLAPGVEGHTNISFPSAGYFDAIGLPVLRGRPFSDSDAGDAPPVIIVNQTLARQTFGGADPVGRQMRVGFNRQSVRTIVGVVADDHHTGVAREVVPNVYLPYEQVAFTGAHSFVVRTEADFATTTGVIRREIVLAEPAAAIYSVRTLEQIVSDSISSERFSTLLLGAFAAAALLLAFVGIYGVTDQAVSQRTQELGIRMALGAAPSRILGMVVAAGLKLTLAGVAVGLAAAAALSRFVSSQLFGVSPLDARAYLTVALLLVAAATLACYVPARRATRIDPLTALRAE